MAFNPSNLNKPTPNMGWVDKAGQLTKDAAAWFGALGAVASWAVTGALSAAALTITGSVVLPLASVALSALNVKIGWLRFHDTAGVITIDGTGGNITLSVVFRTGTAAGDYQLVSATPFANGNWFFGGIGRNSGVVSITMLNNSNPLHDATKINFFLISPAGALARADEMLCLAVGV